MLGAARHAIPAYASSPLLTSDSDYVDYCHRMLDRGYRAINIHPYCAFEDDVRPVRVLVEEFAGRDIGWSLDSDGMYSLDQAMRMGRVLDAAGWGFFEAPLPDADLKGYRALAEALDIDVVCGGSMLPHLQLIDHALGIGGLTGAAEALAITRAHGRKAEIQSWGYTLTQAANLHLMLAHAECTRFEQATPFEKYEFGARQVIRPDADGLVRPSGLPGLGVELDWERIEPYVYARREFAP